MGLPYFYRHSGLTVASHWDLPEWASFASTAESPDVRIVLSDRDWPDCPTEGCMVDGQALRFAVEGVGSWQIEGGHTIQLYPHTDAQPPELRLYTLGSAWAALGYMRGAAMWHASAIARGGHGVLLCGESGQGKSTLAAALVARGANLVSDDLARVEPGGAGRVYPSATRIKLWSQAIAQLGWDSRKVQRDWYREDKFQCEAPRALGKCPPVKLAAIVSLEEGATVRLTRLEGTEALETVLRQTMFRPEMIDALGAWGEQGAMAARIVSQCPVYRLARPRDLARLGAACEAVEALFN